MAETLAVDHELHIQNIDKMGYTVIPGVLPQDECKRMADRLSEIYEQRSKAGMDRHPSVDPAREHFVFNLHNKDNMFLPLIDHPAVVPILERYLDTNLVLNYFNARATVKGSKPQHFHIDSRVPFPTNAIMMQAIWMINDFTVENGATRVVPGSHKWNIIPDRPLDHPQARQTTGKAGSVLLYNSSLWHGAGPSTAEARRWGILVIYGRWFVKPSMDFTKNTPPAVYARLNLRQKQYLGFNSVPPYDENVRINTITPLENLPASL